MSAPRVALFTTDETLTERLQRAAAPQFRVQAAGTVDALTELLSDESCCACLLDFRTIADGGHEADRLAERIAGQWSDAAVVLLVPEPCPELLERRAAVDGVPLLRGHVDPEALADQLRDALPEESPEAERPAAGEGASSPSVQVANDADGGHVVLEGLTRRFETYTLKMKRMLADLEVAARHDVTILLIGETGSGKTYLSRLIHEVSPRRSEPFLHVPCGALPSELIESELFGHQKGSFTSAHADKEGKFVAAGRGTILLDEIDVLGPEQQVKLLRVIETGEFEPVGSNVTHRSQARLVVASNLDLHPLVEQGRFRPDLYYRLNMLKFEIAPLRDRPADVEPLAREFLQRLAEEHGKEVRDLDERVVDALLSYPWPGNVRELENVMRRAVIYATEGTVEPEHLPPHIVAGEAGPTNDPTVRLSRNRERDRSLEKQVALTEKEIIEQALFRNNFSKTNTAKDLGISRVTLYNKLKKYGLHPA